MAQTFYAQNLEMLRHAQTQLEKVEGEENPYMSTYIGSYLSLDPCGRYHHILSINGLTSRCEAYWESLEKAATRLGGWIESGEGDPLDQYYCEACPEEPEPATDDVVASLFAAISNLSSACKCESVANAVERLAEEIQTAEEAGNSAYSVIKQYI